MWMTDYIREIQRQFVEVYRFPKREDHPDTMPKAGTVPDGEYPMKIEGKIDKVRIKNGSISCCNFDK